ncbi:MAG: aldo/keto reductase [Termitinemataceae bacterium]|nr:MAG: aldo/keto reductase [Termitinemataceae bacterium]
MQYRTDPKYGNKISVLGFGCMRFPKNFGVVDIKKSEALVMKAIEKGVNYFDTARIYYGNEEALGTIVSRNRVRDKILIASKLPGWQIKTADDIEKIFQLTLEKLNTDYIDYYLIHMLSELSTWERLKNFGIEKWIENKKKSGQIRRLGFSFHGDCGQYLKILDAFDWDATLIQYNYSNENFQAGITGLKAAYEKKIPVFIMEPLLGGTLVNDLPKAVRTLFEKTHSEWTPARWGLNWLWNQKEITMTLSGMNSDIQLEDNLRAAEDSRVGMLDEAGLELFAEVRRIFNESYKIKCTGCSYCMPCPGNVNIPGCFASYNASYALTLFKGLWKYSQTVSFTAKTMRNASRCINCGKCEQHCPQALPIRANLKLVKKRLEPFWFWLPLRIARKFIHL